MTQNIYDDQRFFDEYGRLERSVRGLDGAAEWPAMRELVGEVGGLRIVDLGCGYGWFCRWAERHGAARVLGIDVSERMLQRARDATTSSLVEYERVDLESVLLPTAAFDLAYSSLAFHYLLALPRLLACIHDALVPEGRLVFSVEHPILTASHEPDWVQTPSGQTAWPVDHYFDEGLRTTNWLVPGVRKHHRRLGTYVRMLREAGFGIESIDDWGPTPAQVAERPDWASERNRPLFLVVSCRRA